MRGWSLGIAATLLASTPALADHADKGKGAEATEASRDRVAGKGEDKREERREGRARGRDEERDEKTDGGKVAGEEDDEDDDDAPATTDGGKPEHRRHWRTREQRSFRKVLWEHEEKEIEERVHKDGKRITDEEREIIKAHWRRVARLMRIRELAQQDKEEAIVKRVDAALERTEKGDRAKLETLNGKGDGGAP